MQKWLFELDSCLAERLALKFAEGASNELERQRAEAGVKPPCGTSSRSPIARCARTVVTQRKSWLNNCLGYMFFRCEMTAFTSMKWMKWMKCQKSSRLRCYQNWSPTVREPHSNQNRSFNGFKEILLNTLKNKNSWTVISFMACFVFGPHSRCVAMWLWRISHLLGSWLNEHWNYNITRRGRFAKQKVCKMMWQVLPTAETASATEELWNALNERMKWWHVLSISRYESFRMIFVRSFWRNRAPELWFILLKENDQSLFQVKRSRTSQLVVAAFHGAGGTSRTRFQHDCSFEEEARLVHKKPEQLQHVNIGTHANTTMCVCVCVCVELLFGQAF